jgi:hypothetical protein
MAERPTASPSGKRQPAGSAQPSRELNTDETARIPLHGGRSAVPGWFWGLLGCLTVLGVGFAGLFLVVRSLAAPTTAGVTAPGGGGAATPPGGARGGGIQVEQLASPPAPALAPFPAPRARPAPRGVKVARSPGSLRPSAAGAAPSGQDEASEAVPEAQAGDGVGGGGDGKKAAAAEPRARKATAAAPRERHERETPSGAPDDDDDDDN